LVSATEDNLVWQVLARPRGNQVLLHLAADPTEPSKLYAVPHHGGILASQDGGKNWAPFAASASTEPPTR
jgi:hypothetical protein